MPNRIQKTRHKTFALTRITRERFERILEILNEDEEHEVQISTDEFAFNDIDDLIDNCGFLIPSIQVTSTNPYVSLSITALAIPSVHLYAEADTQAETNFLRIQEIIEDCSIAPRILSTPQISFWIFMAYTLLGKYLVPTEYQLNSSIGGILFGWLVISLILRSGMGSHLSLKHNHEKKAFWFKSARDFLFLFIGGAIGAVGKFVVDYFVG